MLTVALQQFLLPDAGEGLTEAEILTWHVQAGDTVTVNQIIVEIETAKAAVELPSPYAGVVAELLVQPGVTVDVGAPIITIDTGGAEPAATDPADPAAASSAADPAVADPAAASSGKIGEEMPGGRIATLVGYGPRSGAVTRRPRSGAAPSAPAPRAPASPVPASAPAAPAPPVPAPAPVAPAARTVPLAKPPVRALARSLHVDLDGLTGSGVGGVITRDDVLAASAAPASTPPDAAGGERRVPVKGVRKVTAAAMVASAFTAPHVTEFLTVDVTEMMELRTRLRQRPEFRELRLTPLAFAAKAVCLAAARTPDVNARFDADAGESGEIVYFGQLNLGIAAATPRGLVVPNIRGAQALSLAELARALGELTDTAREGRTAPAAMTGGTFTITNVGVFGVDTGTPIINPGESAILALGAIKQAPWVVGGELAVRTVCQLALSFDHRVVDGQQGSRFLADVGALLADPGLAITY